jgi:alginate O-acetyltransferase complex protein AlgI
LGISFFTFRAVNYILDIYYEKIKPTRDSIVFFTYVAFFPTILSGPIDLARNFIPQLEKKRVFDYSQATEGLRQILWGLFKKIVIADNCAFYTNQIFDNFSSLPASSMFIGAFLYTIQLYADFSGYSDMAIGISRLIGINIAKNFKFPFFAQNIADYWRRWHISLTSWLTEYVFTPLSISFRDYGKLGLIMAIILNFTICGIWHGANWTFVLFGFLHGCYFIPLILRGTMNKKKKVAKDKILPSFRELVNMTLTFTLVMLTLIVFRSNSIEQAYHYFARFFSFSLFSMPIVDGKLKLLITLAFIFIMFVIEWVQREKEYGLQIEKINNPFFRMIVYYVFVVVILAFGSFNQINFIYFQF